MSEVKVDRLLQPNKFVEIFLVRAVENWHFKLLREKIDQIFIKINFLSEYQQLYHQHF